MESNEELTYVGADAMPRTAELAVRHPAVAVPEVTP